ncbi:metal ABC transporter ATP-binding protein [Clostridium akagii]|uniref:metal ABC transporter ATP-binding protein n=1 Tax=Clostridium akagii TaxID=91623 RepID=UPI00047EB80B|nr:metal ABC transporter ATP-binding protein [Clostridium akagii]
MIKIKNLYFTYNKSNPYTLNDINLNVEKGSYLSIIGENGSGKSTLMKLILNLLKPTSGTIEISTKKIGYVPQIMDNFNSAFPLTVEEMLKSHMKALKIKDKGCIARSLSIVKMGNFKNQLIGSLSGGQRQKIFIARAIMGVPELIVLDEPSSGIDVKSQAEIYSVIKDLNTAKKITILSVEHNMKAAIENSTHIFNIDKGQGYKSSIEDYINLNTEVLHNAPTITS